MHVKLTPTAIGVVKRKSPKGGREDQFHMRGPELFGFSCILLLLLRGELIQCCTQNFPCAEGELIRCNTKSGRFGLGELRREPMKCLK